MEVRILHKFHDKADFSKVYLVGETVKFDDERAEYLVGLGLVEKVVEESAAEEDAPASEEEKASEVADETDTAVEAAGEAEPIVAPEAEDAVKPVATRRRTAKNN